MRRDRPLGRGGRDAPHPIDHAGHLARPDAIEGLAQLSRQAVGDAVARPAAVEPEHQPRLLRRAAIVARIEAEAAVKAAQIGRPALGELEFRVPHQRAVGKYPDRLAPPRKAAIAGGIGSTG